MAASVAGLYGRRRYLWKRVIARPMKDSIEARGTIVDVFTNSMFDGALETGQRVPVHLSGGLGIRNIRIVKSDSIMVEISTHDVTAAALYADSDTGPSDRRWFFYRKTSIHRSQERERSPVLSESFMTAIRAFRGGSTPKAAR
jgi:translation initiation factor IF-1